MAAGKSTRMYPVTLTQPKPLIRIANKPILAHQLDQLVGLVKEVILIVGYQSKMIQEMFGYSYRGIAIGYVEQREQLGTGHAAMQARPYIRDRFILMNGDDLYARKDIEACLQSQYALLAQEVEDPRKFGVLTVENGLVRDLIEKPEEPASNLTSVGLYVTDTRIFKILDTIPKSPRGEYEVTDAMKRLAQAVEMRCQVVSGYWIPVGYPWHVLNANDFLLEHDVEESGRSKGIEDGVVVQGHVWLDEQSLIRKGTYIQGNVRIGKHCMIGPNCHITGNTSIGDGCQIEAGTVIVNSVIDRYGRLAPFCHISHSVLGESVTLGTGTVTMSEPIKTPTVTSMIKGQSIASDRKQFGVTIGSRSVLQPHVVTFPGIKVAPETVIPAGKIVKKDLM